jgi:hypothetical protein
VSTVNKIITQIVASALVIVAGFFLFNFVTNPGELESECLGDYCFKVDASAEYGFRPYGVAVVLIGASYLGLILFKNWQDNQSLNS